MKRHTFALCLLSLCTGLLVAQAPATDAPPTKVGKQDAAKADAEVTAYLKTVAAHITSENAVIRRSSQQAVAAVGTPALPMLKELAGGKDEKMAGEAKRLIARIESASKNSGQAGGMGGRMGRNMDATIEELGLTAEQEVKTREILAKRTEDMASLMEQVRSGEIDRREMMEIMREQMDKTTKDLEKILPADKVEKLRESLTGGMGGGRQGPGGQGRGRGRGQGGGN